MTSALTHSDPAERIAALDALRDTPDAEATVAPLLADPAPAVREHASRLLSQYGTAEAAREAATYIRSTNVAARNLAGETLMRMGAVAVPELLPYLSDADHDVRKFAIDVLAELPAGIYAPRIAEALDDPDANVRLAAIDALGALGATAYADVLTERYDTEPLARPSIVEALGAFQRAEDLPLLETALTDENPVVQLAAAEAISRYETPEVLPLLMRQREAVHPMARPVLLKAVVQVLQHHPDRAATLPHALHVDLVGMLDDPDPTFQAVAVDGLSFFVGAGALGPLLQHAGRSDALDLKIFTALAGAPAPFTTVLEAASDRGDVPLTTACTFILGLLGQGHAPGDTWPAVATLLTAHFDALSVEDQLAALHICAEQGHHALAPVVEAAMQVPHPDVRSVAEDTATAFPGLSAASLTS